jgi:putative oxidoreductase
MAYVVVVGELGGGLALIAGILVRWVSIVLTPVLLGAAWVHLANGWAFSTEWGGWEYPVFPVTATIVQALLGAGAYAVKLPFVGNIGQGEAVRIES